MAQIFHRSTNTISRVSVFGSVFLVFGLLWLMGAVDRSPYVTQEGVVRAQPVPFSHKHHVGALGIDCRYCHTAVEEAASAGLPSTKVCMTCHSILWNRTELLEAVRASYREDESIAWTRVHDLPDFVYFDHSIHVAKGVGCTTCHGRVDEMPLMWRQNTLHMEWCIGCHRAPEENLRPLDRVFDVDWDPGADPHAEGGAAELGAALAREHDVRPRLDCYTCHR